MVSGSRISPTRSTSGSSRSAERIARENDSVSSPISRWLMAAFLCRCTYSSGSSMVMMWHARRWLTASIIAARVVDLPAPVGPVTRIRPCGRSTQLESTAGSPRSAKVGIRYGISRSDSATDPRWW